MFTGLIEDVGTLAARRAVGNAAKLEVRTRLSLAEVAVGESIAVNGACLTVEEVRAAAGVLVFHALSETLGRTNLGQLATGALVNLERAMRLGDRLGGHLVTGHVDSTAHVMHVGKEEDDTVLTIELPEALAALVVPKGSIAVDGISLTVAALERDTFCVHIIPHTWQATNLRMARAGQVVNLEADLIGKYILRQQQVSRRAGLSMDDLRRAGF